MSVIRAHEAQQREYRGITFERMVVGTKSMVTKMHYVAGNHVPEHSHPNEQSGYVISGRYRLRYGSREEILQAGDSYCIPADIPHSVEALESGEILDVFTPPRADFL